MRILQASALILSASLAASAVAAQDVKLYKVEVRADLNDFADSNALTYWPDLEGDLQRAIIQRVKLSGKDEDPSVEVLVSKVSVDGDTLLPDSGEFNQLEGSVAIYEGASAVSTKVEDGSEAERLISRAPLRLVAQTADTAAPEGWVMIPPSQDDFYTAMIEAFAAKVVSDVKQ